MAKRRARGSGVRPYYEQDGIVIYHSDCRDVLPTLLPVHLGWSSPPYLQQRDYGRIIADWDALVPTAFSEMPALANAQMLVNLGLVHRNGMVIQYWDTLIAKMAESGWRLFGWYVWDKGSGLPGDWNGRLAPSHEFIFHFNKVSRTVNKIVKSSSQKRGGIGGLRSANGTIAKWSGDPKYVNPIKIEDSVLRLSPQKARNGFEVEHPAVFPLALAATVIASFTNDGETVCDPFMGIGTTLVAAKRLGRRAIGIEIEERYCEIAAKRLSQGALTLDIGA